jgi:hypothetical protein
MALPYTTPIDSLPSQMLTYKQKMKSKKKWGRDCVDALEQLGRRQYYDNLRFLENYQMLNGKFMPHHYFEQEGYKDMLTMLTHEFDVPSTLRHYDIIGKTVNNLTEKLAEFPDVFHVQEIFEEDDTNEYTRTQSDLMHKSVQADINREIQMRLVAEGLDSNKQDFQSEDEAMQYQKEIQSMEQAMEPHQIQKYMETSWQSQGEIWGQHQLQLDRQRYKLDVLERKEFRDMLITDRCLRHFFLTGDGYDQETWNPMNTFMHVSPDVDWAEDGDYVGRIFYLTKADIIKRYGWKMDASDMKALETLDKDYSNDLDFNGFPYKVYAPFEDYKAYDVITRNSGYDPINRLPMLGDDVLYEMTNNLPNVNRNAGLFRVTEVYWVSQRKLGKYVHIDPETGQLVKDLVDENFIVPEHVKELTGEFYDGNDLDTVYWTWADETWKGVKICFAVKDNDAIYLDIDRCDFQFRGDRNPFTCKLPVCGRIFNNRNAQSMSLVDFMKPHQIGYNVCMNQLYQLLEKETGVFAVWDVRFFNNLKDWGGEDSFDKVAMVAKELGHVFGDTSPQNMQGANPGNQLPKIINMELTSQMFSRAKLAQFFEERCLSQLGVAPQAMAEVKTTETATGINTAVSQTALNVQRYYTDFFEYKQRCLTMDLDISQFVQVQQKDVTISYTKSDQSRVFLKMLGTDLLLREMHVYVVNSQQLLQQLQQIKNLFLQSNTTGATPLDLVEVITANSPAALKVKLKESMDNMEKKEQAQQQNQQQQFQAQLEHDQETENRTDQRNHENNETKVEVAQIAAGAKTKVPPVPATPGSQNSQLDYSKFNAKTQADQQKNDVQQEANEIKREKNTNDKLIQTKQLDLQRQKITAENRRSRANVRVAKEKKKDK